jgi:uncharacterized membrane protein
MSTISVSVTQDLDVKAAPDEVFAVVSETPRIAALFDSVEKVEDLGGNAYKWVMKETGKAGFSSRTVFASRYTVNAADRTVQWAPIEGVGNARSTGRWTITPREDGGTHAVRAVQLDLEVPIPRFAVGAAKAFVSNEFQRQTAAEMQDLVQHFGAI